MEQPKMERRSIEIQGIVQGVGFRPFVFGLASRLGLRGFVRNSAGGVWVEVEGPTPDLDRFLSELASNPPPLAQIDRLNCQTQGTRGDEDFRIEKSDDAAASPVFPSPDVATCSDCLAELFDPTDRRYRYPFINCTNCGPRLTIITGAPFEREHSTMAAFPMCPLCRNEYQEPADRRFHAQAIACPDCGPRLSLHDANGDLVEVADPLTVFVSALHAGKIGALKGLGGFHLACLATNRKAVVELRRRKQRDEKPFALMVANVEAALKLCEINSAEAALLQSPRRPIVLARKRPENDIVEAVAPQNPNLGLMLPYTPLHHLLMADLAGVPLVMTSGNRSDEPIVYENADALRRLSGIADLFLTHDRSIHVRCDDSVTRIVLGCELPLRRSRGYAPQPIRLPFACPQPILAVGGQLKNTFALGRGKHAFVSHHLGDLDHFAAYRAFVKDIELYQELLGIVPEQIACDLHPDYQSTRYAAARARMSAPPTMTPCCPLPTVWVQHHHAHMASCMAENGLDEPVIGVIFDGAGLGVDNTIWGGEILTGDYRHFCRVAHLRCVPMPGGEQAIREPWRMALAHLHVAGCDDELLRGRVSADNMCIVHQMLDRRVHAPLTSSVGRLFDAVAVLAGLRTHVSFEGQAAMELEWHATEAEGDNGVYDMARVECATWNAEVPWNNDQKIPHFALRAPHSSIVEYDARPLIRAVVRDRKRGVEAAVIARRFHASLVNMVADACNLVRKTYRLSSVVLSGGVFMNALLTAGVRRRLQHDGFRVYGHRLVPPNDGGLSLGQLAVAAATSRDQPNQKR